MWKMRRNIEEDEYLLMKGSGYIYLEQNIKVNNKCRFWVCTLCKNGMYKS